MTFSNKFGEGVHNGEESLSLKESIINTGWDQRLRMAERDFGDGGGGEWMGQETILK